MDDKAKECQIDFIPAKQVLEKRLLQNIAKMQLRK
jgi:hypothetical protein